MFTKFLVTTALALPLAFSGTASAQTAAKKPDIVVIMADDVGIWNISAYHRGMMGGSTPNIDRIAKEGALFTDYYAQQSCTAGRVAFILGQPPFRTGLLKVGMPAAKQGLQDKDPTISELLKPYGYATARTYFTKHWIQRTCCTRPPDGCSPGNQPPNFTRASLSRSFQSTAAPDWPFFAKAQPANWTQVGMLSCKLNPSIGFVIFGHQSMECRFTQNERFPREAHLGG